MCDVCASGHKIKGLTVVDDWTHESLAIDVAGSKYSGRGIGSLSKLVGQHGAPIPKMLLS